MSIGNRVTGGAATLVAMRLLIRFIGLFSTMVLARLLVPEDFGLVGLAMAYLAIIEGITSINLGSALIKIRDESRDLYDTAWTLGLMRSGVISLVIGISASFLPALMNEPRLENVIYIIALQPLIQGLMNPRFIEFEKNLNYRPVFINNVTSKIISTVIAVTIALIYRNYWALIIGSMASSLIGLCMGYVMRPYLPRWNLGRVREIFGFTAWLSGVSILSTLNLRLDSFIVGGFLDTKHVGYYRVGEELTTLPTGELVGPLTQSLFPAFSEMAHEPEKLKTNVLEASSVLSALTLPASFGFAFLAEDIVRLLVGEQWLLVVPMIQILTPIIGLSTLTALSASVCMATGRTRDIFLTEIIYFVVRISVVLTGIFFWGFMGLIWARVISGLTFFSISNLRLVRAINVPFFLPILHAWRSILSTLVMVCALWAYHHAGFVGVTEFPLFLRLGSSVVIGAVAYIAVHGLLWILSGYPQGPEERFMSIIQSLRNSII
ncbi:MAG: lipopolysaccharide biosynthesis protein [Acidimicrobiales bacterium]